MAAKKRAPKPARVRETPSRSYNTTPALIEIGAGAFKDQCLQLLDQVRAGEAELLVTKHGVPVARVLAPDASSGSSHGFMRGTILAQQDIVSPDPDAWNEAGE